MAPGYVGLDRDSWRALGSAFLELFIACLLLLTATISLLTAKLIKFFELPHPCTFLGLQHGRSLCEQHRRLSLLMHDSCVGCLRDAERPPQNANSVLPLFSPAPEENGGIDKFTNPNPSEGLNLQDNVSKLPDDQEGVQDDHDVEWLDRKVAGEGNEEVGQDLQESNSMVWYDKKNAGGIIRGDRCVKRKFAKVFVEELKQSVQDKVVAEGKSEDVSSRATESMPTTTDGDTPIPSDTKSDSQASEHHNGKAGEISVETVKAAFQAEKDALSSLYAELDEERNASAIAANEAMAMITRLQEEKAAVQMEARQYQRMVEEKAEYDQEAITLLKEILLKREQEKFVLEKEVESYRNKLLRGGSFSDWDPNDEKLPLSLTFDKPDDVLLLEGNRGNGRHDDELARLRGINLLHNFESVTEKESPGKYSVLHPEGSQENESLSADDEKDVAANLGVSSDEEWNLRHTSGEDGTEFDDHVGEGIYEDIGAPNHWGNGVKRAEDNSNSDLDLRTTSMVMRDNFRLAMEEDIKELTSRLQVLEDDRQLLKQIVQSLKAEKQELRELAQHFRNLREPVPISLEAKQADEGAVQQVSQVSSTAKKRRIESEVQQQQELI